MNDLTTPSGIESAATYAPNPKAELPPARAACATELVGYQDGAVVSRVLVRRDKGNVTVFAFDEGQELSEHAAPFDALLHVLEGRADVLIDGAPSQLAAGEVILLPANHPHAVRAISRFKMLLIMLRS